MDLLAQSLLLVRWSSHPILPRTFLVLKPEILHPTETLVSRQTRMDGHLTHKAFIKMLIEDKSPFQLGKDQLGQNLHPDSLSGCWQAVPSGLWVCPESFALSYSLCQSHCVRSECLQDESTVFGSLNTKSHSTLFAKFCLLKSSHQLDPTQP